MRIRIDQYIFEDTLPENVEGPVFVEALKQAYHDSMSEKWVKYDWTFNLRFMKGWQGIEPPPDIQGCPQFDFEEVREDLTSIREALYDSPRWIDD